MIYICAVGVLIVFAVFIFFPPLGKMSKQNASKESSIKKKTSRNLILLIVTLNTFPPIGDVMSWIEEQSIHRNYEGYL